MNNKLKDDTTNQTLNMKIYERLKERIMKGYLSAGSRLREVEIAKQMNVSTTPVREAFRQLATEGLVKIVPWKGAIVQSYSVDEIRDAYQCRVALELLAIQLAVERIDEKGIEKLDQSIVHFREAGSATEIVEVSAELHNIILEYSGNKKIKTLLTSLNDVIHHERNVTAYSENRKEKIYKEHIEIVDAIRQRDSKKAQRAMKMHLENGYEYSIIQHSAQNKNKQS